MKNSDQGFSLLESLVAIIVLGIVMAGGMAFYYNSNAVYYHGLHYQMATWAANSELEQIKSAGCTATAANTGSTVSLTGNASDTTHVKGTLKILWPTTTTKSTCTTSNDIVVQVIWTEPGELAGSNRHVVSLETNVGS